MSENRFIKYYKNTTLPLINRFFRYIRLQQKLWKQSKESIPTLDFSGYIYPIKDGFWNTVFAIFVASIIVLIILISIPQFLDSSGSGMAKIGAFGDVVGGLLNPILSLFAIILIIRSISIQSKELKETKKEIHEGVKAAKKNTSEQGKQFDVALAQKREFRTFELYRIWTEGERSSWRKSILSSDVSSKIEGDLASAVEYFDRSFAELHIYQRQCVSLFVELYGPEMQAFINLFPHRRWVDLHDNTGRYSRNMYKKMNEEASSSIEAHRNRTAGYFEFLLQGS